MGADPIRTVGDDTILRVRVRRANLAALEAGVTLGTDTLTWAPITLRLIPRDDGTHEMMVVTNELAMANAPEPVDAEEVE